MTDRIKYNLFSIFASTLVSFSIWIYILYNFDPYKGDVLTIGSFFACMFFWLSGFLTMVMVFMRINLFSKVNINTNISNSIRQATIISSLLIGLLVLKSLNSLNIIQTIMLIFIALLLELFINAFNK